MDLLEVDGSVPPEVSAAAEQVIWEKMEHPEGQLNREAIGLFTVGDELRRSEPLALTQLLIVFQLVGARAGA